MQEELVVTKVKLSKLEFISSEFLDISILIIVLILRRSDRDRTKFKYETMKLNCYCFLSCLFLAFHLGPFALLIVT